MGRHRRGTEDPRPLDEVHRLFEKRKLRFALTGSSARKLRRGGVNLLAGRARTLDMLPLTTRELGRDFDLAHAVRYGGLPGVWVEKDPAGFLSAYVKTYLEEEVRQEGLTRNLAGFVRFLEAASFSQASVRNVSAVARDCGVERKTVDQWFQALEDLLLAVRLPMFTRRAKRAMTAHPRFFLFDAGVYRTLRPRGPLDADTEIDGPALETFVLNELRAANSYFRLGYSISSCRTEAGAEVDFVLYGERGLHAIEVKRSAAVRGDTCRVCAPSPRTTHRASPGCSTAVPNDSESTTSNVCRCRRSRTCSLNSADLPGPWSPTHSLACLERDR